MTKRLYRKIFKRTIDLLASFVGLLIVLPLFLVLIPAIAIQNEGPIFFKQTRPGLSGRLFRLLKFRTMKGLCNEKGRLLSDRERLTRTGKFMRSFSLDELPQLFNVLIGDMSLVGPRPLLPEYLTLYNNRQARRHDVRPGITGWAQVNGRNDISWEEKLEMDVWYIDHISFTLDIKILLLTLVKVIKREGITSPNYATAERFKGNLRQC